MSSKIGLSTSHISKNEINFIKSAIEKNQVTNYGDNLNGFEKDLELYLKENTRSNSFSVSTVRNRFKR